MRTIIALTESSSLRSLAKTPRMVSKADGTDSRVPNDVYKDNLRQPETRVSPQAFSCVPNAATIQLPQAGGSLRETFGLLKASQSMRKQRPLLGRELDASHFLKG
jgi:hypothetical protein